MDIAGTFARNTLVAFGCLFALACSAQVDPTSIAGHMLGSDAPWVVKLCAAVMSVCLGIIWWQQRELVGLHRQSRGDFREMLRVAQKFLDHMEEVEKRSNQIAFIDPDIAELIERRRKDGQRDKANA